MVLVGPTNDHGYNQAHFEAMQRAQKEMPGVKFIYVDKVNPADRPNVKVEQVVDDLVTKGAKLIITNSDDFKDGTREAANAHPDVTFLHMSGDDALSGKAPKNLGNIMGRMEYGKMIAGCAAALTTKTGKISYLGPLINDETRRLVNSAFLGAQHCWTKVLNKPAADLKFKVTWIGFWFNIPGVTLDPSKVATDFINSDYDVNISGIDTTEGIIETNKAAQAGKNVFAEPYDYRDACAEAAKVCLGVPYFNWWPAYKQTIDKVRSGTWKSEWLWLAPDWKDINNPDTSSVGFVSGPALGADQKKQVDTFIAGLGNNSINLWQGPLNFQDGSPFVKAGETANDKQIWYTPQLLKGIDGPSSAPKP
ncbi:MAG: BMP family ABC transporter substrate-binding protein [Herpetosiphon sp.]